MRMKKLLSALLCTLMVLACAVPMASALTPHGTGIPMRNWLTNDPNYDFSDAYKTSVWYENFTALELTKNERNNVLRIAVSQLGYHEGNSADDFDGMNTSGGSNYIEYARLLVPHYNNNAYEWCACFVNWCLNQARIDRYSSEIGCWKWVGELKAMKYWQDSPAYNGTYTPLPADMIFFNWKYASTANNASGHIGYVLYTTDTHVFTIEGNADNNVTVRSYALSDPCIIGYGTPDYKENGEPTIDYAYKNGMPVGYYVVNSSNTALLASPNDSKRLGKVNLGHRVLLTGVEGNYAKVVYEGKEGYVPTNVLYYFSEAQTSTVTFDANGGQNAPAAQPIFKDLKSTLTADIPTLEGDTFVGWATRPYDLVPVYAPGDNIEIEGDVTLYAIWEKHSETLASAAMAEGTLVNYPRPSATVNHKALVLGSIDPAVFTSVSNTAVTVVDDATCGKVLSFATTDASDDPYVVLPYTSIMIDAQLPIANASDVKYVVLRVSNKSLSGQTFDLFYTCEGETSQEGNDHTASVMTATLVEGEDWQYVVFDMSEAKGWDGNIQSLRLDYERSAAAEGETLLISDLYLLTGDDELTAVTEQNIYPFPADEKVIYEEETLPSHDTEAEGETGDADSISSSAEDTQTDSDSQSNSCGSVLLTSSLPVMILGVACLLVKRNKKD